MAFIQKLPNGVLSKTGWTASPNIAAWNENIDDLIGSPDDDSTYIRVSSTGSTYYFLVVFPTFSVPTGAYEISLDVVIRAKKSEGTLDPQLNGVFYDDVGNDIYTNTATSVTTSYVDYTFSFANSPITGSAWTVSGINDIISGHVAIGGAGNLASSGMTTSYIIVTQIYIQANYRIDLPFVMSGPGMVVGSKSTSVG